LRYGLLGTEVAADVRRRIEAEISAIRHFIWAVTNVILRVNLVVDSMPEPPPNAELMRSLGRLVRGLSALFWGLPIALIVCVWTANPRWWRSFGVVPPLVSTGLLVYGLWQLGGFQRQERVWRAALDRARILSLINFGLSPFLYWRGQLPDNRFFTTALIVLAVSAVFFLGSLNFVLQRLGAMLPDEALRLEIKQFTALNLKLLVATLIYGAFYYLIQIVQWMPIWLEKLLVDIERSGFGFLTVVLPLALFVLLPLAMTMALLWKTKEVILDNVFGAE
jgi:hypothetical protein